MADPALMALANMLKQTQHQRVEENRPRTAPPSVMASAPPLPSFQQPGNTLPNLAQYMKPAAVPAPPPPVAAPPSLPPQPAPGEQPGVVPPMPPPIQVGDQSTPGFWERFNKAIAGQQVPPSFRGANGELIGNT